jgi:preprotein translocase subunit YajC
MLMFLETTGATGTVGGMDMLTSLLPMVLIIGVFYFLMIRPENKRKKEAEQMRNDLSVGDRITTIGGIVGTVVSVKDDKFVIETGADQVRVEFCKWALSTNETAEEKAKAEQKRREEEKAKAKAAKKAKKEQ